MVNSSFLRIPQFEKAELLGDIDPGRHRDFDKVRSKYCTKESYLREEVYDAFKNMKKGVGKDKTSLLRRQGASVASSARLIDFEGVVYWRSTINFYMNKTIIFFLEMQK